MYYVTYICTQTKFSKTNHTDGNRQEARNRGESLPIKTGLAFKCDQCGRMCMHRRSLDRHADRNHMDNPVFSCNQCEKTFARFDNLEKHKRTCVRGRVTVAGPAAKRRRISGLTPEFVVRKTQRSLGGAVELFAVYMKESKHLSVLQGAITTFNPVMAKYHQDHQAYKFQIAVYVDFHKAVYPAVITQPPVTLTSEMVAVYSDDSPPLEDVNRQLMNFIEVYEHNGSGWVFTHFAPLKLTLWHLDPLHASDFVPLPPLDQR